MNSSETPVETPTAASVDASSTSAEPNQSMQEYYDLQQSLLRITLILTGIIFVSVWIFYSLNIALNYLIGACTGVVYLRMLARNVALLGKGQKLSSSRLALVAGVILVATRLDQLQVIPIFLGFLTYKAAVVYYMLRTSILPGSQ